MYPPTNGTSLGLSERVERVLCYSLLWVSGLVMLLLEQKNPTVQRHARQSLIIFGGLTLIAWVLGLFPTLFGWLPVLGDVFTYIASTVTHAISIVMIGLWILLMVLAWFSPLTLRLGKWQA